MAVRFDADGEAFTRTGGLGLAGNTVPVTWCFWAKRMADRGTFSGAVYIGPGDTGDGDQVSTQSNGDVATSSNIVGSGTITGPTYTNGAWFFLAVTLENATNGRKFYHRADGAGSLTLAGQSTPAVARLDNFTQFWLGDVPWSGEWFNGDVCCARLWNAVLSSAELLAESNNPTPVRTSGLQGAWRLATTSDTVDQSGNGRNLTGGSGAATDTDEPADIAAAPGTVTGAIVPAAVGSATGGTRARSAVGS